MQISRFALSDLCRSITDCPHSTPQWTESGNIVIRNQNIKNGMLDLSTPSFTNDEDFRKRLSRATPVAGDIIITREAPMGEVCRIPENVHCCLGQRMVLLKPDYGKVNGDYLLYALMSKEVQFQISWSNGTGTTVSNLRIPHLCQLKIPCPNLDYQNRIASVVSTLNNRIKLNRQINDNLLQQLQAIYQRMFSQPSPGDMLEGRLSDICAYSQRRVSVASLSPDSYYSTENMLPGKAGAVAASSLPTIAQTTGCMPGDILISNIRPYFKKIVYCQSECGCSTDVLCFVPQTHDLSLYLFSTLYDDHFFDYMVAGSKGTKMPRGDKQQIMAYPIVLPSTTKLVEFNAIARPLLSQIENGTQENKRLASLRDTLLPRLMSGEIDVSDVTL